MRQSVRRVERVEDAPLRLVTLIDSSASMRPRLEPARQAALQFLRRTLRPRDQAAVITFNRSPHVAVGLTGDLEALENGLSGLMADEDTSLYDSLIFSLQYLGGAPGQRAILLLSDGEDHTSTFGFAEALESARRAGIAVYAIGIDLPKGGPTEQLARLAAETGGGLLPARHGGSRPRLSGDRARSALALPDLLSVLEHQGERCLPRGSGRAGPARGGGADDQRVLPLGKNKGHKGRQGLQGQQVRKGFQVSDVPVVPWVPCSPPHAPAACGHPRGGGAPRGRSPARCRGRGRRRGWGSRARPR